MIMATSLIGNATSSNWVEYLQKNFISCCRESEERSIVQSSKMTSSERWRDKWLRKGRAIRSYRWMDGWGATIDDWWEICTSSEQIWKLWEACNAYIVVYFTSLYKCVLDSHHNHFCIFSVASLVPIMHPCHLSSPWEAWQRNLYLNFASCK